MDKDLRKLIFKSLGLAMGVAVFVLSILKTLESESAITLLAIGLICLALCEFESKKES